MMSAISLWAGIGMFAALPLLWSALVALARHAACEWRKDTLLSDFHEKAVLVVMMAPVAVGCALFFAPQGFAPTALPPMLPLFELSGQEGVFVREAGGSVSLGSDWFLVSACLLLIGYGAGVSYHAIRLLGAHLLVWRWVRSAHAYAPVPGLYLSASASTPFAASGHRVIFPRNLFELLGDDDIRFILAHERHHHARGDVAIYVVLAWLDVLAWFNPFVRAQTARCRAVAELECDAAVTASAPDKRRAYAQTLLTVLKHTAGNALPCAPAVLSHRAIGEHRMRIVRIMKTDGQARKRWPWVAYVAALALAAPIGVAQLALAQTGGGSTAAANAALPTFSQVPLVGRVSSDFGDRTDPFTGEVRQHSGVDIIGAEGDAIVAPAAGRVARVLPNHRGYGNTLEIDHGGGYVTRYAQLSAFEVREGEQVTAGQLIARVGSTGRATGPHLHLEVWREGVAIDPAQMLDFSPGG